MFGLTKREQSWKAEERAAELIFGLLTTALKAKADIEIAQSMARQTNELYQLRLENAELKAIQTEKGE